MEFCYSPYGGGGWYFNRLVIWYFILIHKMQFHYDVLFDLCFYRKIVLKKQ